MGDAALALIAAAEQYDSSDPLNIGTGVATPLRDIAKMIAMHVGYTGDICWDGKTGGDKTRCFDVKRMESSLTWRPRVALDDGLRETVGWYRAQKQA